MQLVNRMIPTPSMTGEKPGPLRVLPCRRNTVILGLRSEFSGLDRADGVRVIRDEQTLGCRLLCLRDLHNCVVPFNPQLTWPSLSAPCEVSAFGSAALGRGLTMSLVFTHVDVACGVGQQKTPRGEQALVAD